MTVSYKQPAGTTYLSSKTARMSNPQDILLRARKDLALLEAELVRLQYERDVLYQFIQAHEASLAPIQKLPAELLSEIFIQCVAPTPPPAIPSTMFAKRVRGPRLFDTQMTLCQVSNQWRQIVISTPQLWTSFEIEGPLPSQPLLARWLARSGACPLSVKLAPQKQQSELFAQFIPHSSRWQNLHLFYNEFKHFISAPTDLASLQKLTLEALPPDRFPQLASALDHVLSPEAAPRFHSLQLSYMDASGSALCDLTFWPRLTELSLTMCRLDTEACISLLSRCPNLTTCTLGVISPSGLLPSPPSPATPLPLTLPYLQMLNLSVPRTGSALLSHLTLPALRHLSFGMASHSEQAAWSPDEFATFLTRSRCALESLTFQAFPITPAHLDLALAASSASLKELNVLGMHTRRIVTPALIEALTVRKGHVCAVPRLRCLQLLGASGLFTGSALVDMLESRFGVDGEGDIARLKHVKIGRVWDRRSDDNDVIRRVDALRGQGLNVQVV